MLPDLTGEYGGLIAVGFGMGCAAGYGFAMQVVFAQFKTAWDERIAVFTKALADSEAARQLADAHFRECDKELDAIKIRLARLEGGNAK